MNNARQPVQGRPVSNPYVVMAEDSGYPQAEYPESTPPLIPVQVAATYEMNDRVPVGRPIQPVQHTPAYQPNYQPGFTQQPAVVLPSTLNYANNRDHPTAITCSNCRSPVTTVVNKQPGKVTFAWALILGMSCGLCCVPFCVDSCLDKIHYCPRCGAEAGKKHARFI